MEYAASGLPSYAASLTGSAMISQTDHEKTARDFVSWLRYKESKTVCDSGGWFKKPKWLTNEIADASRGRLVLATVKHHPTRSTYEFVRVVPPKRSGKPFDPNVVPDIDWWLGMVDGDGNLISKEVPSEKITPSVDVSSGSRRHVCFCSVLSSRSVIHSSICLSCFPPTGG